MSDEIDTIRRHLPDDLVSGFDTLVDLAASYQEALHKIAKEASEGEPFSPNNYRAVSACTTIRCLASDALNY